MKDTIYFRHDYDSHNDPKAVKLMSSQYGREGYGLFWATLECMRGESDIVLYEKDIDAFAYRLHYDRTKYAKLLSFLVEIGLLMYSAKDKLYFSKRLQEDVEHMRNKSKKAKDSANTRWKARDDANAMPTHSERNAIKERKGEEKKGKDNKKNTTIVAASPGEYGDPEINEILEKIKMYNDGIIDGTQKEQRQYGNLLHKKLQQYETVKTGVYTPIGFLDILLQIISTNEYHSHKISGPKKVYYNLSALVAICKQEMLKQKKSEVKEF